MRIYLQAYACIWFQYHYQMPDQIKLSKLRLTHWGRVTHICVIKLTIIGSDNGLSPGRRQAIIWTNAGILLIRTLGKNSVKSYAKFIHFQWVKILLILVRISQFNFTGYRRPCYQTNNDIDPVSLVLLSFTEKYAAASCTNHSSNICVYQYHRLEL